MPLPVSGATGLERLRGFTATAGSATPLFWMDAAYNKRLPISLANTSGVTLYDHVVDVTVPGGVTIDEDSMRAVETTAIGGIDQPFGWRYGFARSVQIANVNRLPYLPVALSGSTLTLKTLGDWPTGETRTFHVYWQSAGGIDPLDYHYLGQYDDAPYLLLGRVGPDIDVSTSMNRYGYGPVLDAADGTSPLNGQWGIGAGGFAQQIGLFSYLAQGDGTTYGLKTYTPSSTVNTGPTQVTTGTVSGETRSGGTDWSAAFTMTHQNHLLERPLSNGTGSVLKNLDVYRVHLVLTCGRAYTPQTTTTTLTNEPAQWVMALLSADYGGQSVSATAAWPGDTSTPAGEELNFFYALAGQNSPTKMTTFAETRNQTVAGLIVGSAGWTNCFGFLVNSVSTSNFTGQPSVQVSPSSTGLYLYGLTNGATVPVGATITLDFWYAHHQNPEAVNSGYHLLPSELVTMLRTLPMTPIVTVSDVETYASASLFASAKRTSTDLVAGCQWFADNALSYTGLATNTAFQKELITGDYDATTGSGVPDDDDGNYGEGHKLHGLCLRYLRLHEASVLTQIERQVQFHLDIEQAAIDAYGSWWEGSAPYWYAASALTKTGSEGGLAGRAKDDGTEVEPTLTISYTQGQVRRLTSVDQMHMVAHGLYAYSYLLRNEAAVTANTTLRADVVSYLGRMATFESDHQESASLVCQNLSRIAQGLTPNVSNGMTLAAFNTAIGTPLATPYYGQFWGTWQVDDTPVISIDPSANGTIDNFFRGQFAPDSTVAGIKKYLQGQVLDMLALDYGQYDVVSNEPTWGTVGDYPKGWGGRGSATGNDLEYDAGRAGADHYLTVDAGGVRDIYTGRHAQRLIVMCLAALLDPTYTVPIDLDLGTQVNIVTFCDQTMLTLANYGIEETSKAVRWSPVRWLGGGTPKLIDSAFTGYALMATELWHLVHAGADYTDYYPIGAW